MSAQTKFPANPHSPGRPPFPGIGGGLRLLSLFTVLLSLTMTVPLVVAALLRETEMIRAFAISMAVPLPLALPVLLLVTRKQRIRFAAADGFFLVFFIWIIACLLGSLPFLFSRAIPRLADAFFESVSGFSTTGVSILADVEVLPRSLLLWRAMSHWLGGIGIVMLTVALFPLMGIGGFQLVKAETSGPEKEKITPKITATAKILCFLYLGLTAVLTVLLVLGGMDWLDAVIHSFATIATGGFSARNNSIAAFSSPFIEWVCIVFMILSGYNFALLFQLLRGKVRDVFRNSEGRAYLSIMGLSSVTVALSLCSAGEDFSTAIRLGFFHCSSIATSCGFAIADHNLWPPLAQGVLFLLMFIGGCSGSTAGGVKVVRWVVLFKQALNEAKRLVYPRGVFNIRLNHKVGRKDVVYGVAGFIFLYLIMIAASFLLLTSAGLDPWDSLNAALLCLGNIGLGLGNLTGGAILASCPDYVKWGLSLLMIAGRLEIWTFFVLFIPEYWRR
ncbi:MAG: TrkH family potassium uptake protein [Treponema sp.]|jgi:trk system potassium uptake protein TrkH|nr:TrkH family potassium uptake protein [Treponema sp.]